MLRLDSREGCSSMTHRCPLIGRQSLPQSPTSGVIDLRTILVGDDILFEGDEEASSTKETEKSSDNVRVDVQTPADHVNIDDVIKVRKAF